MELSTNDLVFIIGQQQVEITMLRKMLKDVAPKAPKSPEVTAEADPKSAAKAD